VRACIKHKFVVNHEKTIKKLIKIAAGRYVVEVLKDGKFIVSKEGETKWFWLLRGRHVRFVFELAKRKYPTLNLNPSKANKRIRPTQTSYIYGTEMLFSLLPR
jgi:hypothetical protein